MIPAVTVGNTDEPNSAGEIIPEVETPKRIFGGV